MAAVRDGYLSGSSSCSPIRGSCSRDRRSWPPASPMPATTLRIVRAAIGLPAMNSTATIDPNITMKELLVQFPGAQRALFRKYHIGGCASCGFSPEETLAGVCARNENLDVDEVIEHITASHEADRLMQIEPEELAARIAGGEPVYLLDVRTREEFEAVKLPGAHLFTQELMQEIQGNGTRPN